MDILSSKRWKRFRPGMDLYTQGLEDDRLEPASAELAAAEADSTGLVCISARVWDLNCCLSAVPDP